MRKYYINGLEIDFDGPLPFRLLNPMFNDRVSHTYNLKTINTARNKDVINQLHLPEVGYNQVKYASMIVTDALVLMGATYFNSVTDNYLDFQFNSQSDFWNLANVSLRSINIPFDARYLPISNSKLMDNFPLTGGYSGYMNALDVDGNPVPGEQTAPVPFLKLNSVIEGIFSNFGFGIISNELKQHADINQLYMFNSNSNGKYEFPIVGFDNIIFSASISDGKYVFHRDLPHDIVDGSYLLVYAFIRPLSAQMQLSNKVLKVTVEDEFNISFDITPIVSSLSSGTNYITIFKPHVTGLISEEAKNHLPEITCGNFLKEVEKLTSSRVFINESSRECRIIFLKNIINSNDVDDITTFAGSVSDQSITKESGFKLAYENPSDDEYWSSRIAEITDLMTLRDPVATAADLPLLGSNNNDVRLVLGENAYYRYSTVGFLRSSGWDFYSENFLQLQSGEGKFSIQTKFSPLLVKSFTYMMFPFINKEGQFMIINQSTHDDFRLFFYRGEYSFQAWRTDHFETISFPMCTNDVYNPAGVKIPAANLSLRWDGEYGLYNQLHLDHVNLMVNRYREETRYVAWPAHMLNSFAWWKKYRVNHLNYLVKSIDAEILQSGEVVNKNTVLVPV